MRFVGVGAVTVRGGAEFNSQTLVTVCASSFAQLAKTSFVPLVRPPHYHSGSVLKASLPRYKITNGSKWGFTWIKSRWIMSQEALFLGSYKGFFFFFSIPFAAERKRKSHQHNATLFALWLTFIMGQQRIGWDTESCIWAADNRSHFFLLDESFDLGGFFFCDVCINESIVDDVITGQRRWRGGVVAVSAPWRTLRLGGKKAEKD